MDLLIYNSSLACEGVVDEFKSLIWHRKYFQSGEFTLVAGATQNNINLIQKYNYILKENSKEVGYITSLEITNNLEQGTIITASGNFLSGIISQRSILTNEQTLSEIITSSAINATDNKRNIVGLTLADDFPTIAFENSVKGKNLGEMIEALARRDNFGYRIMINSTNTGFKFNVFYGINRSIEQSENPHVIFSKEYDNLVSNTYVNSDVGMINTVYGICKLPAGIEPCTPPTYSIDTDNVGLERYETCVETEAVTYDQTITVANNVTITKTYLNYNKTLANMKSDCENAIVLRQENFEGDVSFESGYKTLYDLGDVVTVFNKEWNKSTSQRITEIMETYDNQKNAVTPTFGTPERTIMDILKKVK